MPPTLEKSWLAKLTRLNPATGRGQCRGKAPHKPLLLLCLVDLAEAGELPGRNLIRSGGLVLRFKNYGMLLAERWPTKLDMRMPFFYLRSQGFWQAYTLEMQPAQTPENCHVIELHPEFFELLGSPEFRLKARLLLISRYFEPAERMALLESLGFPASQNEQWDIQASRLNETAAADARKKGRSARFAVQVVSRYKFTCALTGYNCLTSDGAAIVDAAHIEPFAKAQNDDLENGLALCKNAHWMFDEGLWTVSANGRIQIDTHRFSEHGPEGLRLMSYQGRFLQFANGVTLRPKAQFFERHRLAHGIR